MRYLVLACDYDGTLAHHGRVDQPTMKALERFRASGRKLVLVTGRRLEDLLTVFPNVEMFELLVVENGALLYRPATRKQRLLGPSPPPELVQMLRQRKVAPLDVGHCILATWEPHEAVVLETIRDLAAGP